MRWGIVTTHGAKKVRLISQLVAVLLLVGIAAHYVWWIVGLPCIGLTILVCRRAHTEMLTAQDVR